MSDEPVVRTYPVQFCDGCMHLLGETWRTAEIDSLRAQLASALKRAEEAERERDEARDWVRQMHRETQILTCVYCGQAYPPGTPASGSPVLTEHIKVCEQHPMREAERARKAAESSRDRLREALIGLRSHRWRKDGSEDCWCVTEDMPAGEDLDSLVHEDACNAARAALSAPEGEGTPE